MSGAPPRRHAIKPRHGFVSPASAVPPAPTFGLGGRSRVLPAACAVSFAHGFVGYVKPGLLAALNCTQPGRGKSPAIQHNRAFCKMQPVANQVGLVSAPLRALRVRRRVGYVWRPGLDNGYVSSRCSARLFSAARLVALLPRPPGGSACGGSHCVAPQFPRCASATPLPSAPKVNRGLPSNLSPCRHG